MIFIQHDPPEHKLDSGGSLRIHGRRRGYGAMRSAELGEGECVDGRLSALSRRRECGIGGRGMRRRAFVRAVAVKAVQSAELGDGGMCRRAFVRALAKKGYSVSYDSE